MSLKVEYFAKDKDITYLLCNLRLEGLFSSECPALCLPLPLLQNSLWDCGKLLVWHFAEREQKLKIYASTVAPGMVRIISESPGSVMERVQTLKYFPQAVPSSLLSPT